MQKEVLIAILLIPVCLADEIFIDKTLSYACSDYSPATRTCGSGSDMAYNTFSEVETEPGDTVYLRGGEYDESLIITDSGTPGNFITYTNYEDEEATITGLSLRPAIDISDTSHIRIDRLRIDQVTHWLYALNTEYAVISNNYFGNAIHSGHSQKTGLFFQEARFNRIINNTFFDNDEDSLALIKSDHNLVEGNNFTRAYHTLWTIKCGSFNVIRNNYFHNDEEKIGEVFDCDDVGFDHEFNNILNSTKRNLIEGNIFAYTPSSGDSSPYAGIQYAGQEGIIRNNIFYDTVGPGLSLTLYPDEAKYNLKNRMYNNIFYSTDFAGISLPRTGYDFYDNIIKNNILYRSIFVANDQRWPWYTDELDGKPVQLIAGRLDGFVFYNNNIFNTAAGELYLITYGNRDSDNGEQHPMSWWEDEHPDLFADNIEMEPGFYSEYDFHLQEDSDMIDAGTFLTVTTSIGDGNIVPVEDVLYFYDGFDMPQEAGDLIRIGDDDAYVIGIEYESNTLMLDRDIQWSEGDEVSMPYGGESPDMGAFEYNPDYESPPCVELPLAELMQTIQDWLNGSISMTELFTTINLWKHGC